MIVHQPSPKSLNRRWILIKNIEKNLKKNEVLTYFLFIAMLFVFLFPPMLEQLSIYRYVRLTQTGLTLVFVVIYLFFMKKNKYINLLFTFFVIYGLASLFNERYYPLVIFYITNVSALILFLYWAKGINLNLLLEAFSDLSLIYLTIHALSLLVFPTGVSAMISHNDREKPLFFLGQDNQSTILIIIYAVLVILAFLYERKHAYKPIIASVFAIISLMMSESTTGHLGLFMAMTFFALYFLYKYRHGWLPKKYSKLKLSNRVRSYLPLIGVASVLIINFLFVVVNVQELAASILENLLNNDATISSRSIIWDRGVEMFLQNPLLGYGATANRYIYIERGNMHYSAHNMFLETSLMGGFLILLIFIFMIYLSFQAMNRLKNKDLRFLLSAFMVIFFIMSLVEGYSVKHTFMMLFLPILLEHGQAGDLIIKHNNESMQWRRK